MTKQLKRWTASIRDESLFQNTPIQQKDGQWKVVRRKEAWELLGARIFDEQLDRLNKVAVEVLRERNPVFDLEPNDRFAANIYGKVLKHSPSLRKGLAETLALLGTFPDSLKSCSFGKAESTAIITVREILENSDWVVWASVNDYLPMLAEASPKEVLDAIAYALGLNPCPFVQVFAQEGEALMGRNYMTGLLWALEILAWNEDYFARVIILLGELAAIDPGGNWANRPGNSLIDILLPWHPQTLASIPKRKAAVATLLHEQPSVGWKLLLAILPNSHSSTSGTRKPIWRDWIPKDWPEQVTKAEYWDQIVGYAELAFGEAKSDFSKLAELIQRIPDLPNPVFLHMLEHLGSSEIVALPEASRLPIWDALVDLTRRHRKYSEAKWAMPTELVIKIEDAAAKLAPLSSELRYRRLFNNQEFTDEIGTFEEQAKKLEQQRQSAVREIYEASKIAGVLEFARQVTSPQKVGNALGSIVSMQADEVLLPSYLEKEDEFSRRFISGFIWGRFWTQKWPWVDGTVTTNWTNQQRACLLTLIPFERDAWRRADLLLGHGAAAYWKKVNVNPYGPQQDLLEAVEKLLQYSRPRAAISCLNRLVYDKAEFPPDFATRALMEGLKTSDQPDVFDQHATLELIKWLQGNTKSNQDDLFRIEWAYLPLLDHHFGGNPQTLERRMASDPQFFCEVIQAAFRSEKNKSTDNQPSKQEQELAQNAYRLLNGWKIVPGTSDDKNFDGTEFAKWLSDVKQRARDSGHLGIAMDQVGKVLPNSCADPDGLWIHRSVAQALDAKDAGEIRSGFICQLFNLRGGHTFTAGKEELEIAARYKQKADALEMGGFHRIAISVRELAKRYEYDAKRDTTRDPFQS